MNTFDKNDLQITETLLYDNSFLGDKNSTVILNVTIDFAFVTKIFDVNLLEIEYDCLYSILVEFIFLFFYIIFSQAHQLDICLVAAIFMFTRVNV